MFTFVLVTNPFQVALILIRTNQDYATCGFLANGMTNQERQHRLVDNLLYVVRVLRLISLDIDDAARSIAVAIS